MTGVGFKTLHQKANLGLFSFLFWDETADAFPARLGHGLAGEQRIKGIAQVMLCDHFPWFAEILIKIIDAPAVNNVSIRFRQHYLRRDCGAGGLHQLVLPIMDSVELGVIVIFLVRCDLGRSHFRICIHQCELRLGAITLNDSANLGRELVGHRAIVCDEKQNGRPFFFGGQWCLYITVDILDG